MTQKDGCKLSKLKMKEAVNVNPLFICNLLEPLEDITLFVSCIQLILRHERAAQLAQLLHHPCTMIMHIYT